VITRRVNARGYKETSAEYHHERTLPVTGMFEAVGCQLIVLA
jgi:hypothetical protein